MFARFRMPTGLMSFLLAVGALLMALNPAPASAQGATPPPASPDLSCSITDISCMLFGNGANLQQNIDEANAAVTAMGCWSCKVFNAFGGVVFTSGRQVAGEADSALRPVIVAVATIFALFYMGSAFVSGDASDLLSRWKTFWKLLIAVAFGTAWLSAGSFDMTWNYIYGPLLQIPLAVEASVGGGMPGGSCEATTPANAPSGASAAMSRMAQVVCGGNEISLKGISYGIGLANTGDGIVGSFVNLIAGVALTVVFAWIAITFPLRFIDVLLRLMVVGIVAPVLVVCAVFKPLRSYVQIGIRNVLYAGALFAFTGIMFKIGYGFIMEMADGVVVAGGSQSTGELLGRGIVLVGSGVIFAAMIRMAPSLAAEFSAFSGQSGGVGDAASGFASTVVSAPVKGAGLVAGGVMAKSAASKMGAGITRSVASGAQSGTAAALGKSVTPA